MAKLVVNSESLVSVADAIRTKGGTSESLTFPQGFVDAVGAIESGGGTEEIENLIDKSGVLGTTDETVTVTEKVEQLIDKAEDENIWYFYTTTLTSLPSVFRKLLVEKIPRMDYSKMTSLNYGFSGMPITRADYYINSETCTNHYATFQSCKELKYIKGISTSKTTTVHDMCAGCISLKTIEEPLDFSSISTTTIRPFENCTALEDVRFVSKSVKVSIRIPSPVLSIGNVFNLTDTENVGSVQSIINGLVTLAEGAAAQTLTLNKNLPLTEEQKQAITTAVNNKGWTLAFG